MVQMSITICHSFLLEASCALWIVATLVLDSNFHCLSQKKVMQELGDDKIKIAKLSPLKFQNVRQWREHVLHPLRKLVLLLPAPNPTSSSVV